MSWLRATSWRSTEATRAAYRRAVEPLKASCACSTQGWSCVNVCASEPQELLVAEAPAGWTTAPRWKRSPGLTKTMQTSSTGSSSASCWRTALRGHRVVVAASHHKEPSRLSDCDCSSPLQRSRARRELRARYRVEARAGESRAKVENSVAHAAPAFPETKRPDLPAPHSWLARAFAQQQVSDAPTPEYRFARPDVAELASALATYVRSGFACNRRKRRAFSERWSMRYARLSAT